MGYISPPQPASHQVTREIYLRDCTPPGGQCGLALPSPLPLPSPSPHGPSTPGAQDSSFSILWRNNYRPQPYRSSVPGKSSSQPSACHRHSGCPPDVFIGLPKPEMVSTSSAGPSSCYYDYHSFSEWHRGGGGTDIALLRASTALERHPKPPRLSWDAGHRARGSLQTRNPISRPKANH